jgi:hypothetical protein
MLSNPRRKAPAVYVQPTERETVNELRIAKNFTLPVKLVTETVGIVAQRGAGKTYLTAVMIEELTRLGLGVCVIDPMGVYWGLLSSADGESEGIPIVVLGGDHAHVELSPQSGREVAKWVAIERRACVIDISHFRKGEQRHFVMEFAEELYQQKAKHREALHLVLDEADLWAPQRPQPGEQRMLGAVEDLVRRGRSRGIGLSLVTQRPAVIAKDVLTQVSALIALRITGPQDRKAVEDWIKYHGDEEKREQVLESLGTLPIGTAWFWSPGWLGILKKIQVRKRLTFDSSATPEPGQVALTPKALAPVDFAELRERFAAPAVKEEPPEPEPAEAPLPKAQSLKPKAQSPKPKAQSPELNARALASAIAERLGGAIAALQLAKDGILTDLAPFMSGPAEVVTPPGDRAPRALASGPGPRGVPVNPARVTLGGDEKLSKGERKVLTVLSQHGSCSKSKVAILCEYAVTSGTFSNLLSTLRVKGFLVGSGGGPYEVTVAGRSQVSVEPLPPEGTARRAWWMAQLPKMERVILTALVGQNASMSFAALAKACGYNQSGSLSNAVSRLRVLGLATGSNRGIEASREVA